MPLRTVIPTAVFAAFAFFIAARNRPLPGLFRQPWARALVFFGSLAALTWWAFGTFELFPALFSVVYSLFVWSRGVAANPTPWRRLVLARWAPLAAGLVLAGVEALWTGRFDAIPIGFGLLPFLRFPFDRGGVEAFFSSARALVVLAVALAIAEWGLAGTFDPEMLIGFALIGIVAMAIPEKLRFVTEDRWRLLHPAIFGLLSAAAVLWTWGSLHPVSAIHDEASYLLQARLFAHGQWKAPSPPIPEFFEQLHVLVTPVMASKYPPGHALVLATGIRSGYTAAVPILLTGIAGALFFALARRLSNSWVALFAWLLWIGSLRNLDHRATYMSEVTTSALWLAGWWFLLRWKEKGGLASLVGIGACVAWGAITRPLTMLAFAIPAAVVVVRLAASRRAWRDLILAAIPGAAILAIVPLWSHGTTGSWRTSPLQLYTKQYMPYDLPGFGPGGPRPARELPPELTKVNEMLERHKDLHTVAALPQIFGRRLRMIKEDLFGTGSDFFVVFVAIGLFHLTAAGALAVASSALLVLLYLTYWHVHNWTIYYLELSPVLCFVTALGIWRFLSIVSARLSARRSEAPAAAGRVAPSWAALFGAALFLPAAFHVEAARGYKLGQLAGQARFRARVNSLSGPAIVFVRHGPLHDGNRALVENGDDLSRLPVWIVHDRGEDNERLLRSAPGRTPYLYDEARGSLQIYNPRR